MISSESSVVGGISFVTGVGVNEMLDGTNTGRTGGLGRIAVGEMN